MTSPSSFPRPSGFSLIEVVLAVGIVSFCLVSLMSLLSVSMNASKDSTRVTANSLLFQKVVNQLRMTVLTKDFSQAGQMGVDNRYPLPAPGNIGQEEFSVDEYNRYVEAGSPKAMWKVTVNVANPIEFKQENGMSPVPLAVGDNGGKNAVVCVTIRPARGSAKDTSSFSTELNLATQ